MVLDEAGHEQLRDQLQSQEALVSSVLTRVETVRACARYGMDRVPAAQRALELVALVPLDDEVLAAAATLPPSQLRSLDAIHLATALSIEEVEVLFSYDQRLADAARAAGLDTRSPGA